VRNREGAASLAGTNAGGGLLGLGSARAREQRRRGKRSWAPGLDKHARTVVERRDGRRVEGSPPATVAGIGGAQHSDTQSSIFERILTIQISKFHIGT
jgi:hypothetical protein